MCMPTSALGPKWYDAARTASHSINVAGTGSASTHAKCIISGTVSDMLKWLTCGAVPWAHATSDYVGLKSYRVSPMAQK